jgi:hypothetical protein
MVEQLPKEVRVKIAAECTDREAEVDARTDSVLVWHDGYCVPWVPDSDNWHHRQLARTVAREIKAKLTGISKQDIAAFLNSVCLLERLNDALATDDVPALERLLAELRGWL